MRCLLDKVVARYIFTGFLKLSAGEDLTKQESFSLDLFARASVTSLSLFIVPSSAQVLQRMTTLTQYKVMARRFLERVAIMFLAHYYKRWTRRLREHGFSREDAATLAFATFGTNEVGEILGAHFFATYDQALLNNWTIQYDAIQEHLGAMQRDIHAPYCKARLPKVLRPEQLKLS